MNKHIFYTYIFIYEKRANSYIDGRGFWVRFTACCIYCRRRPPRVKGEFEDDAARKLCPRRITNNQYTLNAIKVSIFELLRVWNFSHRFRTDGWLTYVIILRKSIWLYRRTIYVFFFIIIKLNRQIVLR